MCFGEWTGRVSRHGARGVFLDLGEQVPPATHCLLEELLRREPD